MIRRRKIAIILLAIICAVCAAFAFGCSQSKKYYTVTFMNGQSQVGEPLKVEKGKRITDFPYVAPETEYDYLDGWCMDEELSKPWNEKVERVTKDVTLYAKFLHITEVPNNPFMGGEAFSNTLCWLQRGEVNGNFSVELFEGVKVSRTDYDYAQTGSYAENDCTVEVVNYKGEPDIYLVSWTAAEKPAGGVYAAKVVYGGDEVTFEKLLYKGAGTEENPYLIESAADFAAINTADVAAGNYYKLLNNITVRAASSKVEGYTFDGNLDGNGKTVTIEASDCGLFATLGENAKVYDLTVDGSIPGVSDNNAGVIASVNNGVISYCNISATITGELGTIGELELLESGMVGGCGGVAGINNGRIENCAFTGTVQASVGAGGIAAVNYGTITSCTNGGTQGAGNANETGSSTRKYSYMGGIVAVNFGTVSKSGTTNSGKLLAQRSESGDSPNNNIGGIAAYNAEGATITECWFDGIRVHGNKNVGGIAGENAGEISYCFAAGVYKSGSKLHSYIGGYSEVGGIAGLTSGGTVKNCFVTANVYAYGSNAYSTAQSSENCVYLGVNLDAKQTAALSAPQEGNLLIEVTEEDRAAYEGKTYTLALTEEQLAAFNGTQSEEEEGRFVSGRNGVRLGCEGFATVLEHSITVKVHGASVTPYEIKNTSGEVVSLGKNNAPAAEEGYYLAGWALKDGGEIVFGTKATGYSDIEELGMTEINLYPVYAEGEDPYDKILDVAVYRQYVEEDIIKALISAFEVYCNENQIEVSEFNYTMIGGSSMSVGNFCTAVSQGNYNIMFGQRANLTITVIGNTDTKLVSGGSARRIAKLSEGPAANAFYDFVLNNDTAKKILDPDYISEAEAQKIEVTLISDNAQYGDKLTISNATDAAKVTLPAIEVDKGFKFAGWATTAEKVDNEVLLTGEISYDDLAANAQDGLLTLYARIEVDENAYVYEFVIGYYNTKSNACTAEQVEQIKKDFIEYCAEKGWKVSVSFIEYSGVADIVEDIQQKGNLDYVLNVGTNITTTKGTTSKQPLDASEYVEGSNIKINKRYVIQIKNNDYVSALHAFAQKNGTVNSIGT